MVAAHSGDSGLGLCVAWTLSKDGRGATVLVVHLSPIPLVATPKLCRRRLPLLPVLAVPVANVPPLRVQGDWRCS